MNILAIGDIVGTNGCSFLRSKLNILKSQMDIDLVIANGENSADGNGITPSSANYLFDSGVDVITLGNHTFRRPEIYEYLENSNNAILRPYNFPKGTPGKGLYIHDMGRIQVAVINLMGQAYLDPLDCPFKAIDEIFENNSLPKIVIVDFHAEATGEKRAFGFYADGKVSGIFGTHTHVPTADAQILPKGTAYITDVGMTGGINSVLGVKPELIIKKLKTKLPVRFENSTDEQKMDCFLMNIDEKTGLCVKSERFSVK
ncbi:MAG: TIGR00282 family metallophosphoesterase [Clostridia bacterium]